MDTIIADADEMLRTIRPSEAVKAYQVIENSAAKIVVEKTRMWNSWTTKLGPFIRDRTVIAKNNAGSTRGSKYAAALREQMKQFYPIYQKLSENGTVSYLARIMDNLEAIEAWRSQLHEEDRPAHPMRVWLGYEASLIPTVAAVDAPGAETADGEEENDENKGDSRIKPKGKSINRDEQTARYIEELEERLGKHRMTTDPQINAENIWFAIKDVVGYEPGIRIARATIEKLIDLLDRIEKSVRED